MKYKSNSDIHSLLHYIVSRAALEGKTGWTELSVPLVDLLDPKEGIQSTDEANELVLKVRIETSWTDLTDIEHEFEAQFIEDDETAALDGEEEEEDEEISTTKSGSGKTSH